MNSPGDETLRRDGDGMPPPATVLCSMATGLTSLTANKTAAMVLHVVTFFHLFYLILPVYKINSQKRCVTYTIRVDVGWTVADGLCSVVTIVESSSVATIDTPDPELKRLKMSLVEHTIKWQKRLKMPLYERTIKWHYELYPMSP
jgi:hypothetical protein